MEMELNRLYHMDCIEGMKQLPDNSIDLILCDLPYGVTDCKWDNIIPFDLLWEQYNRIAKENAAVVLFSIQPFTTKLIQSNLKNFRYCWYWVKNAATGFTFAKYQPMRKVEDICVFYKKHGTYNPQGLKPIEELKRKKKNIPTSNHDYVYKAGTLCKEFTPKYTGYPHNILNFSREAKRLHPTQKPLALCEYLIRTYTNAGEVVLDSCAGSGTTLLAAKNTGRQYIGFETNEKYYHAAIERLTA